MGAPRRFMDGITNVSSADPMGALPYLDPTKWVMYYEDFCGGYLGANAVTSTTNVANGVQTIASANGVVSVVTDADAPLGCLSITNGGANDNDYGWLQTMSPGFIMTSGKKFIMETRFEITAATVAQCEMFIGLASYSASVTAAFATAGTTLNADDGIGLYSGDADANINFVVGEADVYDSQVLITTYVTATWYQVSMYYDGANIYLWLNNARNDVLTPDQIPVSVIGPMFFFKAGEAAEQTMLVDYLFVAAER
jgi:hypothetical protein